MMETTLTLEPHPNNPKARQRILAGDDGGSPFRVVVPLRIKTIDAALDWLRPAEVPADALRQGEFYFIPSAGPHVAAGCRHGGGRIFLDDCGSEEYTEAGSEYFWRVDWNASFSRTHTAVRCYTVTKSGSVLFRGHRKIKSHDFTSRPRYFVQGPITHGEHGSLELPPHPQGKWYEVIPNKVHGPFPVVGYGQSD